MVLKVAKIGSAGHASTDINYTSSQIIDLCFRNF